MVTQEHTAHHTVPSSPEGIPLPIVTLNRWVIVTGVVLGTVLKQPLFTTALFLVLLPAALFGRRWSLIVFMGKKIFGKKLATAEREDVRLARFNNSIAAVMLGAAQVAFLADASLAGWLLSGLVALAAAVALAGYCVGCFLFFQFKMQRYRLRAWLSRSGSSAR